MRYPLWSVGRLAQIARIALVVVSTAFLSHAAAQTGQYFAAVSELNCSLMLEQNSTLATLVDAYSSDADLVFTRAIPGRLSEYEALRDELDGLVLVPVPFEGEDLDPTAEPEAPRLLPTTRANRVYIPGWEKPLNLALAAGSVVGLTVYGAILDAETRETNPDADANAVLLMGGLGLLLGVPFLLNGSYETETVELPANERTNERTMQQYQERLREIRSRNAERARKREEQQRVREQNAETAEERERLQARLERFGVESQEIAQERIDRLDDASLRCLDRIVYAGAVARYDANRREGRVTLAVTPLARSGDVMASTRPEREFLFSVSRLRLFGEGGASVEVGSADATNVRAFDQSEFPILPVTAMALIDSSGSMADNDPRSLRRVGLERFLAQASEGARIGVMEFGSGKGRVLAPITSDLDAVRRAISTVRADGGTPLYAAGRDAIELLKEDQGAARRVLVILSDGEDSESTGVGPNDLVRAAREASIPIHAIGLGGVDFREFERVANESGGTFTPAPDAEAVVVALARLGNMLNAAYAVDVIVPRGSVNGLRRASDFVQIEGTVSVQHEGVDANAAADGRVPLLTSE